MISTGPHLKQAREALDWTHAEMARALRLSGGPKQGEKRVREMEAGQRDISGPVTVAIEAFLRGFAPHDFVRDEPVVAPAAQAKPIRRGSAARA